MPRPLLKKTNQMETSVLSAAPARAKQNKTMDPAALDLMLRKKRSPEYMKAVSRLDMGNLDAPARMKQIAKAMEKEFPEIPFVDILIGIVGKCYLGDPYEVHTLTIAGNIITHYKRGESLPDGMEKARALAACGAYAFVEVYHECCRAVSQDGSVSVVPG